MTTITKERIELFIKNPLENGLTRGEQMELARIALASLEADPVKRVNSDQMHRVCLEANRYLDKYDAMAKEVNKLLGRIAPPAPVLPHEWRLSNAQAFIERYSPPSVEEAALFAWNSCRAAMLQSGNFRENKNSSTNNFREIAETSTNYPAIPSEVLSAILKVARIRADFDDFDGDRRGIGDCLDEAEQELIVTINKYASQLAAEPIAPNDVREQTAIPQVPVTPDGWISCSERMPDDRQEVNQ
ncbi:TPA: Eaa protein [Escherichia coli]|nr:Eaa protein [Escherichia coli]